MNVLAQDQLKQSAKQPDCEVVIRQQGRRRDDQDDAITVTSDNARTFQDGLCDMLRFTSGP